MVNETNNPLNATAPIFQVPIQQPVLEAATLQLPTKQTPITAGLQDLVRSLIGETLTQNTELELVDEEITDASNLGELDKIPDIVKCLREFTGNPAEYTSWRKSVDRIFEIYKNLRGTAKYFGILSTIRNKIIGPANVALESYNTPLNWTAIKKCLDTHYADKRDIGTLEYQLASLVQGNKSIEEFYQCVYNHFSLILNAISSMNYDRSTETVLIDSYRNKALDTFVRRLNGDLPRLLAISEPKSLPEALHMCTKLNNQNYRTTLANRNNRTQIPPTTYPRHTDQNAFFPQLAHFGGRNVSTQRRILPPLPPRRVPYFEQRQNVNPFQFPNNYAIQNQPQQQSQFFNQQHQNVPLRPHVPKPLPPPEPMDVDHSLRSQAINYANRSNFHRGYINKIDKQRVCSKTTVVFFLHGLDGLNLF